MVRTRHTCCSVGSRSLSSLSLTEHPQLELHCISSSSQCASFEERHHSRKADCAVPLCHIAEIKLDSPARVWRLTTVTGTVPPSVPTAALSSVGSLGTVDEAVVGVPGRSEWAGQAHRSGEMPPASSLFESADAHTLAKSRIPLSVQQAAKHATAG